MKTLSAPVTTALQQSVVVLVQLVEIHFASGVLRLNTSNWHITWGGNTYLGAWGLGSISAVEDAPGEVRGLQFTLSGSSADSIALALDGADQWQGVPIVILTAVLDPATYQVIDAGVEWSGLGDTLAIQEDGGTCVVQATAESSAVDLLRGTPVTYTDADQQAIYPGDLAFQYVNSQAGQPVVWPAKEWFRR